MEKVKIMRENLLFHSIILVCSIITKLKGLLRL